MRKKTLIKKGIMFLAVGIFIGSIILPSSGNELNDPFIYECLPIEFNPGNLAYGVCYDTNEELNGIVEFYTNDPSNLTLTAPDVLTPMFSSCFAHPNHWYFSEWTNGILYFVEIDIWELNAIGGGGDDMNDLAWDFTKNKMYGASNYGFYEIDMDTGYQTYIGGYGGGPGLIKGISCDLEGTCYGIDIFQDKLWTIDTDTGYATEVGSLGVDINVGNVAFDKENNQLFITEQDLESSYLYTCDLETGEATLIGEFPSGTSIATIIIPYNWSNQSPDPPEFTGPDYGQPGVNYTFCVRVVDPDEDAIYFLWDWGDGETTGWFGPYASGDLICFTHAWSEEGTYTIKVKAKDEYGAESDWVTHVIVIDGKVPSIKISKPQRAIYIRDRKIIPFIVPLIFGDIQIWFSSEDSLSGLNRTELYIDDELKEIFTICPKSWMWNETTTGKYKHVIKLIAYDNAGNNATKKMSVWKFF